MTDMASMTPNKTSKQMKMKVGGLLMAALIVLLPALIIGTASAERISAQPGHTSAADGVNSGGNTTCEVLWNTQGSPVITGQNADLLSSGHHLIVVQPQVIDVGVSCVNIGNDVVDLGLTYGSVTVTDSNVNALAVQTVSAIAGAGTNHTLSFTWDDGTDSGGANITVIPMLMNITTDMTHRISMWPGKVNQHNQNGIWMTDSDGVSGGWPSTTFATDYGDLKLEYCQKFWPGTTKIELRDFREEITFWTRYNTDPAVSIRDVYECITSSTIGGHSNPVITIVPGNDFPVVIFPGGGGLTVHEVDPCKNVVFTTGILQIALFDQIIVSEESTNAFQQYVFGQMPVALDPLRVDIVQEGPGDSDFTTNEGEYYDVYVSDADGTLNLNGSFLTIDGFRDASNTNDDVGHNIDSVALSLSNGIIGYADIVTDFDLGVGLYGAWLDNDGYNERALGSSDLQSTRLGDQNASITVGFCDFMVDNGYAYINGFTGDGGGNKMCPGNSIESRVSSEDGEVREDGCNTCPDAQATRIIVGIEGGSECLTGIVVLSGSSNCITAVDEKSDEVGGVDLAPNTDAEKSDEGRGGDFTLLDVSEDEQLVAAGVGAGSTLSLLALALRRRLLGSPL